MRTRNEALHRKRRSAILKAASGCFVKNGFHQTSMQDICAAVGMSPGALYRFYASKKAIIADLVEQERDESRALMARISAAPTLDASLDDAVQALMPLFADRANAHLTLEVAAEGARNAEIAALIEQADREVREALEAMFERAKSAGELRASIDSKAAAVLLLGLVDGLTGRSAMGSSISAKRLKTALRDLLAQWLKA